MTFTIASHHLLKELTALYPTLGSNPIVPILDSFLFDVGWDKLTITASDLHTFLVTQLPIKNQDELPIKVAVSARILLDTLKALPEQSLCFNIDPKTYTVTITWLQGQYKLVGENAVDYPALPQYEDPLAWELTAGTLRKAIKNTSFVASKDEHRPALKGVHLHLGEKKISFVATDGHRLTRYTDHCDLPIHNHAITIPSKPCHLLLQLLATMGESDSVPIILANKGATFTLGNKTITTYLISEPYPEYENVIPKLPPYCLNLPTQGLLQALKRVAIYANRATRQVHFQPTSKQLHIIAEDLDFANKAKETLNCNYVGEPIQVGFNVKLFSELISSIESERINIYLEDPSKAVIILPEGEPKGKEHLLLIMPILLAQPKEKERNLS